MRHRTFLWKAFRLSKSASKSAFTSTGYIVAAIAAIIHKSNGEDAAGCCRTYPKDEGENFCYAKHVFV